MPVPGPRTGPPPPHPSAHPPCLTWASSVGQCLAGISGKTHGGITEASLARGPCHAMVAAQCICYSALGPPQVKLAHVPLTAAWSGPRQSPRPRRTLRTAVGLERREGPQRNEWSQRLWKRDVPGRRGESSRAGRGIAGAGQYVGRAQGLGVASVHISRAAPPAWLVCAGRGAEIWEPGGEPGLRFLGCQLPVTGQPGQPVRPATVPRRQRPGWHQGPWRQCGSRRRAARGAGRTGQRP